MDLFVVVILRVGGVRDGSVVTTAWGGCSQPGNQASLCDRHYMNMTSLQTSVNGKLVTFHSTVVSFQQK